MTYKGKIEDFPPEIVADMLFYQVMQGSPLNVEIFENNPSAGRSKNGFTWSETNEGHNFWQRVIDSRRFYEYFRKYPKNDRTGTEESSN